MRHRLLGLAASAACATAAADPIDKEDTWAGETSLNAGYTTGNTETAEIGGSLDLTRRWTRWSANLQSTADYAETEGDATRERYFVSGQVDHNVSESIYYFVRSSYEVDEFSGFDSRFFAGLGAGWIPVNNEKTTWLLNVAPGFRVDEVADVVDANGIVVTPGGPERSISARGSSEFTHNFNDNVRLRNNSSVVWAEESTQIINSLSLTSALISKLSARISLDVRHDTNPPDGFVRTDTTTRFGLVYTIGD